MANPTTTELTVYYYFSQICGRLLLNTRRLHGTHRSYPA
jgi:hypothetical protein